MGGIRFGEVGRAAAGGIPLAGADEAACRVCSGCGEGEGLLLLLLLAVTMGGDIVGGGGVGWREHSNT